MGASDWIIDATTKYSRYVIVVFVLATLLIGSGATGVDQASDLEQFETDSEAAEKQAYIDEHFGTDDNRTTVQIVVRDGDVLDRQSFISTLELQQALRENETVNGTLVDEPFGDLASVVATTAIRQEEAAQLQARQEALAADRAELNRTAENLSGLLTETRQLQAEYDRLNASYRRGETDEETYAAESSRLERELDSVLERADEELADDQYGAFVGLFDRTRELQQERFRVESRHERGEIDEETRDERVAEIEREFESVYGAVYEEVLGEEFADLQRRGEQLQADAEALQDPDREPPTIEEQIEQLESMDDAEVEELVANLLADDGQNDQLYVFLPTDYEPGSTEADARMLFVTQESGSAGMEGNTPERIVDSQLAMADLVDRRFGDGGIVFGPGVITDEIDRSLSDSLAIVMPLALLFVMVVLLVAYRDILDFALGLAGIGFVLTWTFGFMGWTGISFNQIMIAVPVLLIGLSIDYAIHLFMRHRERRGEDGGRDGPRPAMARVLAGLGLAFVLVTATAAIGFLANVISPIGPLQDFGIVSAFGITSALLVFGVLVPAAKVELDAFLEARGFDRRKRAFGVGGGRLSGVLSLGQRAGTRAPWVVIALTVLLTVGGVYGATQVDTSFQQEDFLADDPPAWTDSLPEPFAPGEYSAKENLDYVNQKFLRQDTQAQILVEGNITDDRALERADRAETEAASKDATVVLAGGDADVRGPLSVMEAVAAENESFNATYAAADTNGDGVPDEDLEAVYEELFAVAPDRAADVIYRTDDGDYESFRLVISVRGDAQASDVTDQMREVATELDGDGTTATATGQIIVFHIVEQALFQTVIESLLITLTAVFLFMMVVYRWRQDSALLGVVTLLPILFAVAWILGTMYLLEVPFNVMTGTITSLTVGLGIAYNIHMTERYVLERSYGHGTGEALRRGVTGTGGALLGSAATTIGGFGVLVFAILPPLKQFGLITGITIAYAFLGSVFVLPSLLVVWTRHLSPDEPAPVDADARETPGPASNGGAEDATTLDENE